MKKKFRNSMSTWRITWTIGIVLLFFAKLFNFHMFYSYCFFFAVGTIPLFYSFFGYATLDERGLTKYYGIFYDRRKIRLPWDQIDSAFMSSYTREYMRTVGGRVRFSVKDEEIEEAVVLKLAKPLNKDAINDIKKRNTGNIFIDELAVNDDGSGILLKTPPEGGFNNFLSSLERYTVVKTGSSDHLLFLKIQTLIYALNAVIFMSALLFGVML